MFCVRNTLAAFAILAATMTSVGAQAPEDAVKRDLNHYANIVAGYHIDGRCGILASSQRAEYYNHILVIERAFLVLGIEAGTLARITERAIAASKSGRYKNCDAETADAVKQIGVLTQTMGKALGQWLAANDRTNPGKQKPAPK